VFHNIASDAGDEAEDWSGAKATDILKHTHAQDIRKHNISVDGPLDKKTQTAG
jgi:hypothetical protein